MKKAHLGRVTTVRAVLMLSAIALAAPALAQGAPRRDKMVVTSDWVKSNAGDANLVLLHVGDKKDYDAGHIAGARLLTMDALSTGMGAGDALAVEMLPADELKSQLEALGINDNSRVVVYSGTGMVWAASRILFTLENAGFGDRVSLLDGGLPEWKRVAYPVTADAPVVKPGKLSPLKLQQHVVDAALVQQHLKAPGYKVIDARASMFYDGVQSGGRGESQPKGHIPGALSLPFTNVTATDQKLKSADELAAAFKAAGVQSGDKVVVYCHVGSQATAVMLAARTLGMDAVLYDGSFQDWARRGLPVEAPGGAQ